MSVACYVLASGRADPGSVAAIITPATASRLSASAGALHGVTHTVCG